MKTETKDCPGLPERKGIRAEGVTKDLKGSKEREETLAFEVTRVTQDGTVSREDLKEKLETSAPWVSLGETGCLEVLETPGRKVALAEGDQQERRATRAARASRAPRESRGPEVRRVHLVPQVLQG